MNGYLDGFNTFSKLADTQLWTMRIEKAFEPMRSIKMQNCDSVKVCSPRLIFNNSGNWYDLKSMASEAVHGSESSIDTILNLLYFVYKNRFSYMLPNIDSYYGSKLMTIYGYGSCDLVSYNIRLLSRALGLEEKPHPMPHHSVSETKIGNKNFLIDADFRTYYLLYDNKTIATYDDVIKDKYLIWRTKHFGENIIYMKNNDDYISRIYYNDFSEELKGDNPALYSTNFDFTLRPSESINFLWEPPVYYYQNWLNYQYVPESLLNNAIANGFFEISNGFSDYYPGEIFDTICGLSYSNEGDFSGIYADSLVSYAVINYTSPFPIHDAQLGIDFEISNFNDSVEIYFNLVDSDTESVRLQCIKGPGNKYVDINLKQYLKVSESRQTLPFAYKYVLKFIFHKSLIDSFIGMDSIYLKNIFQISKKFLPALRLGKNDISYSDAGEGVSRNIKVDILWNETYENHPPLPPQNPVFPKNNSRVDSLNFEFAWEDSTDPDGDEIVDYEFYLSDRSDMKFPLSPNFQQYVSALDTSFILPRFKVKENGWLNSGETYYWQVRAKDSRGAWGEWSPVWSFTPYGVMKPINLSAETSTQGILLKWQPDTSGNKPHFYRIYGSDEDEGFTPCQNNLIATTTDTVYFLHFTPGSVINSFYRISACSNDGQESLPSEYVAVEPNVFIYPDTVKAGEQFNTYFTVNKRNRIIYYYNYDTIDYKYYISVKNMPEWLKIINGNILTGLPGLEEARKILFNNSLSEVIFTLSDSNGFSKDFFYEIETSEKNNIPVLSISNSVFILNNNLKFFAFTADSDKYYGDKHSYMVLESPEWLLYNKIGDTLYFDGLPGEFQTGRYLVRIEVSDSKSAKDQKDFYIEIYDSQNSKINIFPNPVNNNSQIIIEVPWKSEILLTVYSITGSKTSYYIKEVLEKGIYKHPFNIRLTSGIYILHATMKNIYNNKLIQNHYVKFIVP